MGRSVMHQTTHFKTNTAKAIRWSINSDTHTTLPTLTLFTFKVQ